MLKASQINLFERSGINIRALLSAANFCQQPSKRLSQLGVCATEKTTMRRIFVHFPLKCLAAALVVAVNSFRALQNEETE